MGEYRTQQFILEPLPGENWELSLRKFNGYGQLVAQISFGYEYDAYLSFQTGVAMNEHMRIDMNGNVGIGAPSTGEKLEVTGTVKATAFDGDGAKVINLDGSQINAGTIADARLPLSISRTADVDARFDPSTGHKHTGAAGDGSQISHSTLTEITGADPGSTDAQTNKHVSNAQTKVWQDHVGVTSGNPHGTTAAQVGAPVSVEGVTNAGGDIDLVNSNAITIVGNNTTKQITIGETHSARTDNPHATTAAQIDNQGGTNRITAQINAGAGIINESRIDAAIARDSEVSAKFDVTSGHDHDGVDSKKIPAISTIYFGSLDGASLTNLNGSQITTGTVAAARIDTAIVRTSALGAANGIATLDSSTRLVQPANTVWDGTAGRSASPIPGPNRVPVSGSDSKIVFTATNSDRLENGHWVAKASGSQVGNNGTLAVGLGHNGGSHRYHAVVYTSGVTPQTVSEGYDPGGGCYFRISHGYYLNSLPGFHMEDRLIIANTSSSVIYNYVVYAWE